MPCQHPTATIEGLYLPTSPEDFYTDPVDTLGFRLDPNGIVGSSRYNDTTILADVRAPAYVKKSDFVLNRQSVSFVGSEDLDYIAAELGLDADVLAAYGGYGWDQSPEAVIRHFLARCLGANVLLGNFSATEQISTFRELMPATDFGPYDDESRKFTDATVMITRVNNPCIAPGRLIQAGYAIAPDLAKRFVATARGRRGFVGMVAKGGSMTVGQSVRFVPFGQR